MADRAFTDLELERVLAGDLPATHLDGKATPADRERLEVLRTEHAALLASIDVDAEVRAIGKKMERLEPEPAPRRLASWWRWIFASGALAAAAAAILLVVIRRDPAGPGDDDIGVKGDGVTLVIHTESRRLASGDIVHPGERIRFEIGAPKKGFVIVIGIDGAGTKTTYFPYGASAAVAIDPAESRLLPGAIALDATPGDETFFAIYAAHPFTTAEAFAAVARPTPELSSAQVVLRKRP